MALPNSNLPDVGEKKFGLVMKMKTSKSTLDNMAASSRPSAFSVDDDNGAQKVDTNMMARSNLSASESRVKKQVCEILKAMGSKRLT